MGVRNARSSSGISTIHIVWAANSTNPTSIVVPMVVPASLIRPVAAICAAAPVHIARYMAVRPMVPFNAATASAIQDCNARGMGAVFPPGPSIAVIGIASRVNGVALATTTALTKAPPTAAHIRAAPVTNAQAPGAFLTTLSIAGTRPTAMLEPNVPAPERNASSPTRLIVAVTAATRAGNAAAEISALSETRWIAEEVGHALRDIFVSKEESNA